MIRELQKRNKLLFSSKYLILWYNIPYGVDIVKIQESAENYLESILKLKETMSRVRAIDIANELNFSKPSISIAMKNLKENGFITISENGSIDLTEKGYLIAKKTYEKEKMITRLLTSLGVSLEQAQIDACKIEHVLSDESFNAIKKYLGEK